MTSYEHLPSRGRCDFCEGVDYVVQLRGSDLRLGQTDRLFEICRCRNCGLVSLQPQPDAESLLWHYPGALWEAGEAGRRLPERHRQARALVQRWHPDPGVLLDVGCATGGFLLAMHQIGWQAHGIEVSAQQVQVARQYGADAELCSDFAGYEPRQRFDAITFNHVLEHVPSPRAYLERAAQLLNADGILLVSVPNFDSLSRRLFGPYWTHLDLPRHLFHFTPATLCRLVESLEFQVLHITQHCREDNAIGVRDSLMRWLRHGVLRQPGGGLASPGMDGRSEQHPVLSRAYHSLGDSVAALTEACGVADTFVLIARHPAAIE